MEIEMNTLPVEGEPVEDSIPTVRTRYQCSRSFVILLAVNILTIAFGFALFIKMNEVNGRLNRYESLFPEVVQNISNTADKQVQETSERLTQYENIFSRMAKNIFNTTDEQMNARLNLIPGEMERMRDRLDQCENLFSQMAKNISITTDKQALYVIQKTEATNNAVEKKMEEMNGRLDQYENRFSQMAKNISGTTEAANRALEKKVTALLAKNISSIDKQLLNITRRIQATEVANNASEKKVTALETIPKNMEKMQKKLAKNISDVDERVMDVVKHTQLMEAVKNAVDKFPEFRWRNDTHLFGQFLWKFDEYESRIGKNATEENVIYYSPTFRSCLMGYYEMQLRLEIGERNDSIIHVGLQIRPGEDNGVFKLCPFAGNISIIIFDQTSQPKNIYLVWKAKNNESLGLNCDKWQYSIMNFTSWISCSSTNLFTREKASSRNFIQNDTLYVGAKLEGIKDNFKEFYLPYDHDDVRK